MHKTTFSSYKRSRNRSDMWREAHMNNQGWYITRNDEFLFWIPPYLRPYSFTTDQMLVLPRPWLDVSHLNDLMHGLEWQKIIKAGDES